MMAKLLLDCLIHTFDFSIEVNIEIIPLELSLFVIFHRDVIRHRRHNHLLDTPTTLRGGGGGGGGGGVNERGDIFPKTSLLHKTH
jgi:hypothetical protein